MDWTKKDGVQGPREPEETIAVADYGDKTHADAIVRLLDAYASDLMGGGTGLSGFAKANLVPELRKRPQTVVVLAFSGGGPAGLALCVESFSSFACKSVLNIHDMVVAPGSRGRGLSKRILAKVEEVALARNCCKLTLEVLEGNVIAQRAYRSFGFRGYELDPEMGKALFWQKRLPESGHRPEAVTLIP